MKKFAVICMMMFSCFVGFTGTSEAASVHQHMFIVQSQEEANNALEALKADGHQPIKHHFARINNKPGYFMVRVYCK